MSRPRVVRGTPSVELSRAEFTRRFRERFADPDFREIDALIDGIAETAWRNYIEYRKSPRTRRAGRGFADPDYEISLDWLVDLELIPAGPSPGVARYLGYYGDYATSHDDLDRDRALQAEVRNAAKSLVETVRQIRTGRYLRPDAGLEAPRKK